MPIDNPMSDPSTNPNAQALAALTGDAIFDLQHLALIGEFLGVPTRTESREDGVVVSFEFG